MNKSQSPLPLRTLVAVAFFGCLSVHILGQSCERPTPEKVVAFPAGTVVDGVGTTDMPMTTKSEKARQFMKQGFAMIHCFWFNEAIRSFRDAVEADPECAIAWCGLAAALTQPWNYDTGFKSEVEFATRRAVALSENASDAEQMLIAAFRAKTLGGDDRNGPFEVAMMRLIEKHPNLDEPRLLLAGIRCQMCMTTSYLPNGEVRGDLEFVNRLVEPVMKRNPNSGGALHYTIHAFEPFSPDRAVRAAERIGSATPRSSHMVHMAGHIFHRVGRYADAQRVFARARAIEEEDAKTLGVTPFQANWNYGHNRSFLSATFAEDGKVTEALEAAGSNNWAKISALWRAGDWPAAMAAANRAFGATSKSPNAMLFRGMEAIQRKDWFGARTVLGEMEAEFETRSKNMAPEKWHTQLRIHKTAIYELTGGLRFMEGRAKEGMDAYEAAIKSFARIEYSEPEEYARVPHANYGNALLTAQMPEEARAVFEKGLAFRRHSFWLRKGIEDAETQLQQHKRL